MKTFLPYEGELHAGDIPSGQIPDPLAEEYMTNLIEAEKRITRLAIFEQESERSFIAHKLQEDLAQTLAATKLYLEFAEQSSEQKDHLIKQSREAIKRVIEEIQYLCKTIVPSTVEIDKPVELLEEMVTEWQTKNNIRVDFLCMANLDQFDRDISLAVFRIVQQQLRIGVYCNAKKVAISILEKEGIHLYFSMEGMDFDNTDNQVDLWIRNIVTRVEMINAEMGFRNNLSVNDVMHIAIPRNAATG